MSLFDFEWISLFPLVLRHPLGYDLVELDWPLQEGPGCRVHRLVNFPWHLDASRIHEGHRRLRERRPAHIPHYLCNERRLAEKLRADGLDAHFVSRNAWVDDEMFTRRDASKIWNAIYVARLNPLKQHELAGAIEGPLLFVGRALDPWDPSGYEAEIRRRCPRAILHGGGRHHAGHEEVIELMSHSRVGLCLSEVEGAMRVAVEYQLCGLPVVTVRNRGGRNEFLDPEFGRVVAPEPRAVAAAVRELAALDLPPHAVRASVLRKLRDHRRRYVDLVQSIWDAEGLAIDFDRMFHRRPLRARRWRQADELLASRHEDVPWQSDR